MSQLPDVFFSCVTMIRISNVVPLYQRNQWNNVVRQQEQYIRVFGSGYPL